MKTSAERYDQAMVAAAQLRHDLGYAPQSEAPQREIMIAAIEAATRERDREWRAWEDRQRANLRLDFYGHPCWKDYDAVDPPPDHHSHAVSPS